MADKRISGLAAIVAPDDADLLPITDVSDPTEDKKVTLAQVAAHVESGITVPTTVAELDTTVTGAQLDAVKLKVDGIEAGADVTDATNVAAAGAHMSGGTDVPVVDGGTGASTAAAARTNLGVVIGTDVQAHSAVLDATTASFTTADETKLDGIATAATANATDAALLARANHTGTQTASTISDFAAATAATAAVAANTAKVTNATHIGEVTGATTLTIANSAVATAKIANSAVTNAKLANVATATIKGRITAATGLVEDLTATQARTVLNVADGATANDTDANLKNRANHTGTQLASTISDFATAVSSNTAVAANTAKVTNATHTGEVEDATALTVNPGATVTAATGDLVLARDVSNANALVTVTAQSIADLGGGQTVLTTSFAVVSSSYQKSLVAGPWRDFSNCPAVAKGVYHLGRGFVNGGTITTASMYCATGVASTTMYYVVYNIQADGRPGTLHASIGPFSTVTNGSAPTVTGLSVPVTAGQYWVGLFAPTENAGSPVIGGGGKPALMAPGLVNLASRNMLYSGDTTHSTPQDLSAFTIGSAGATSFIGWTDSIANISVGGS